MKKLHEKSPCCRGKIWYFGNRRRQCSICKKTWSVWKKKIGRKEKRVSKQLVINYINNLSAPAYAQEKHKEKKARNLNRSLEKSRDLFCRTTPWPEIFSKGDLILVADAKVKLINRRWYALHTILVRSINEEVAIILPPVLLPGLETQPSWRLVLDNLDEGIKKRVKVMVCDGHRGLVNYAKHKKWIIQRCHFHLISSIQGRRSRWGRSNHQHEGILIHSLVERILTKPDGNYLHKDLIDLEKLAFNTKSKQLKKILTGFVNFYEDYRNYIYHPEFNLPNTNNSVESFNSSVQNLLNKSKGFRSVNSFEKWIEALAKNKKFVMCRAAKIQQN